jgi:putative ATP-binding cassette transporter
MISAQVHGLGTPGVAAKDDGDCAEERRARNQTQLNRAPNGEGARDLVRQFRGFLIALWLSPGGQGLAFLTIGTVLVVCATAVAQVGLNAWNGPFYEAISARNFFAFLHQLLVFAAIAGCLLVLNVAQTWLREMIKLRSREWLTRDLFAEWLKPGAHSRLALAGEIGVNPDQRIHEDVRRLTELSADLGVGLLQASLLLLSFLSVLWTVSGAIEFSICDVSLAIPGYMVWCALLYAATGSWLTWRVGSPLVSMNSRRYQRESEFRFALFQANQQMQSLASLSGEERENGRLALALENVVAIVRDIVDATAKLTWITAGYGWVSLVVPLLIASPAYFCAKLSFGELMVVVGAFNQVNQSLRWFVDNFAVLAEWRAALFRVIKFREVLSMSEYGCEQKTLTLSMVSPASHRPQHGDRCRRRRRQRPSPGLLPVSAREISSIASGLPNARTTAAFMVFCLCRGPFCQKRASVDSALAQSPAAATDQSLLQVR